RCRSAPAAAAAATATEAARPPATAAASTTARPLAGLADVQLPALELAAVQLGDRALGLLLGAHLDEPEAARPARAAIRDHGGPLARPGLGEERLEVRTRRIERQVPDEQLLAHLLPPAPRRGAPVSVAVAWARRRSPPRRRGGITHKQGTRRD